MKTARSGHRSKGSKNLRSRSCSLFGRKPRHADGRGWFIAARDFFLGGVASRRGDRERIFRDNGDDKSGKARIVRPAAAAYTGLIDRLRRR